MVKEENYLGPLNEKCMWIGISWTFLKKTWIIESQKAIISK